ncbi:MAG: phosphoadenosine phosphosulfate reductase family protein [Duodenibacillus sp.]
MINQISISGGKDSTAMLLLAIERDTQDLLPVFCDTGNEHPITYEYVEYLERALGLSIRRCKADFSDMIARKREIVAGTWAQEGVWPERVQAAFEGLKPTGNPFLDLCKAKGRFPSFRARFCTQALKADVIREQVFLPLLSEGKDIESWQGIRHDESIARSCALERDFAMADKTTGAEVWNYRPILTWTAEECFAMHRRHGIEPNPLYKLGMGRVGCMPCINCRKSELKEIAARFPDQIERIESWEKEVASVSRQGIATFFFMAKGHGQGIRDVVQWAQTDRGGRQYALFSDADALPACSSNYGLCE